MTPTQAWKVLGIAKTPDVAAIRRAYAEKLKAMDVDKDVAGYARLREARDAALRWARMQAAPPAQEEEFDPFAGVTPLEQIEEAAPEAEQSRWAYAAPAVQGEVDPSLTRKLGEAAPKLDVTPGFVAAQAPAEQAIAVKRDPFERPVLLGLEPTSDAVMPAWAHEQALYRLLLPDTVDDDEETLPPLEGWEEAMALGHLKAVLRNAESVSVTAFDEIDNWLAGILTRSWPRSAPLLEPAAALFGWESERGQVSERPAIAFLNARLRGLRFREKVQDPKHPLHKAWNELTTPAQQGSRKGWFVKRAQVDQLLDGVRKNFPEVEHYFDPWRVALWEKKASSDVGQGWFSSGRLIVLAVIFGIQILRVVFSSNDSSTEPPSVPEISISQSAQEKEIISRAVSTVFGPEITFDGLQSLQPDLAALFSANRTIARADGSSDAAYASKVQDLVRERMYATALVEKGSLLTDVQRIRADLLRAARKTGADACMAFLRNRRMPPAVVVPPTVLERERTLAVKMLDARQLGPPQRIAPGTASVPGELIGKVITETGIPDKRVRQAMGGKGSDADQCAVTIGLIDAALGWKAPKEREAILSVL
ncbi:hypothetical protein [Novosphingobium sp. ERW19]|uniref:hypothetical protein n=1 Tax=Novosphingobium sp. ERW19 TaxID=2726186 RepID=UPI0014576A59|nr:hypothetical protein [Novosphingobium sp. ERW19]NLR39623.1 hypothetical protein [Novosphingobium sp. ERW19]